VILRVLTLVVALASPVAGQDMTAKDCAALIAKLQGTLSALSVTFGAGGVDAGRCVMSGVARSADRQSGVGWRADRVLLSGMAFAGPYATSGVLDSLDIDVQGLTILPGFPDPVPPHLVDLQPYLRGIDATIGLNRNDASNSLQLSRLLVTLPLDAKIDVTAQVINADLSDLVAAPIRLAGALVTDADIKITSRGLFGALLTAALGPEPARDASARADAIRDLRAEATSQISQLPGPLFSLGSKSALRTLVADLPDPQGTLRVKLRSDQGIGAASFAGFLLGNPPRSVADLAPVFEGVDVDVAWPRALGQ
jgi:hypothetical protein